MRQLNMSVLLNDFELPIFIYRPDVLDYQAFTVLSQESPLEVISNLQSMVLTATVQLSYDEGFPTLDKVPFWLQMPFEPEESFRAFALYLGQPGTRMLSSLISFQQEDVNDWFHEYSWALRAKSYDMYKIVHHQQQRIQRMLQVEDNHYDMADTLLRRVYNRLSLVDWNDEELDI